MTICDNDWHKEPSRHGSDVVCSRCGAQALGDAPIGPPAAVPTLAVEPARVEQVLRWLLDGHRDADIVEAIEAHWPGQDVQALVTAAMASFAADGMTQRDVVRGWCFQATKDLYRRMVEIGDFVGALRAVKQLAQLAGKD